MSDNDNQQKKMHKLTEFFDIYVGISMWNRRTDNHDSNVNRRKVQSSMNDQHP